MSTASALIDVAAEYGGAAGSNGPQHFDVLPADPLAISFDECFSCGADQIGHLEGWPVHLLVLCGSVLKLQRVQRTGGRGQTLLGKVQGDGGFFQIAMTQQGLSNSEIGARFEQMGGEAMAQRVGM